MCTSTASPAGVDMLVDVHGDEELPYCFIAGSEGIPGWNDRLKGLQDAFCAAYKRSSPDFQTKFGYGVDAPGEANMTICSNQVRRQWLVCCCSGLFASCWQ
jgi:murein tripeptide amidase MpaA